MMGGSRTPPGIEAGFWYLLSRLIIHEKTMVSKELMPDTLPVLLTNTLYMQLVSFLG